MEGNALQQTQKSLATDQTGCLLPFEEILKVNAPKD